jgi:hypothetical protein
LTLLQRIRLRMREGRGAGVWGGSLCPGSERSFAVPLPIVRLLSHSTTENENDDDDEDDWGVMAGPRSFEVFLRRVQFQALVPRRRFGRS